MRISVQKLFISMAVLASLTTVAARANSVPITVTAIKTSSATVVVAAPAVVWSNILDSGTQYLASDAGAMAITGTMQTSGGTGSGTIAISSPANITGVHSASDIMPIDAISMTCSGTGNIGPAPTYAAAHTPLAASTSTTCATWGAGANVVLNFNMALFLDDRTIPADTYTSVGFSVVATAT